LKKGWRVTPAPPPRRANSSETSWTWTHCWAFCVHRSASSRPEAWEGRAAVRASSEAVNFTWSVDMVSGLHPPGGRGCGEFSQPEAGEEERQDRGDEQGRSGDGPHRGEAGGHPFDPAPPREGAIQGVQ